MLRRTQTIPSRPEPAPAKRDFQPVTGTRADRKPVAEMQADIEKAFGATAESRLLKQPLQAEENTVPQQQRFVGDTVALEEPPRQQEPTFSYKPDRRKSDRRSMDALREEALRKVISRVEDRNFGGFRDWMKRRRTFRPARVMLLVVALAAGGAAAFLATQGNPTPSPIFEPATERVTEVVREARLQILVAREPIGVGERLSPASLEWVDWPQGSVREEYITSAALPTAIDSMSGTIARFEFFAGEPIRPEKLAGPGDGYMSAVLEPGKRGVSVKVTPESASGGFILPNDHVDVILTSETAIGQVSETILHNVRVLAINSRLGETGNSGAEEEQSGVEGADAETDDRSFKDDAIATLALDAHQAEVIVNATTLGQLALVLRSMDDFAEVDAVDGRATNAAIRMTSPFWIATGNDSTE